jgi:hypothetical protein
MVSLFSQARDSPHQLLRALARWLSISALCRAFSTTNGHSFQPKGSR